MQQLQDYKSVSYGGRVIMCTACLFLLMFGHSLFPNKPKSQGHSSVRRILSWADPKSIAVRSDSCMANALHQLCSSFSELMPEDIHDSETKLCHQDPETFLKNQYETKYNPSKSQLATRALMYEKQIRNLSVGAHKHGICNDVVKGHTVCTDREQLDLFETNSWMSLVLATRKHGNDDSILDVEGFDVVFSEHVLEHFDLVQAEQIAAASFVMLKPGGRFRVAVPDGYKPSPSYQQYIRPGSTPSGAGQNHMVAWTIDNLPPIFLKFGFLIEPREYFEETGKFVSVEGAYQDEEGFGKINRSFQHDHRNQAKPYKDWQESLKATDLREHEPMYTSLWFDAVKPESCNHVLSP